MREIIGTMFRPMRVVYTDISLTLITVAVSYLLPAYPMFWRLPVVMQCPEYSPRCKTVYSHCVIDNFYYHIQI